VIMPVVFGLGFCMGRTTIDSTDRPTGIYLLIHFQITKIAKQLKSNKRETNIMHLFQVLILQISLHT